MRYFRIFFLCFENVFEYRATNVVWFLVSLINPLMLLVYWLGYYHNQGISTGSSEFISVTTYYFLLVIASSMLMSHVEEEIAYDDIQLGGLTRYLVRPFSYTLITFISEMPWRIIQGLFGVIVLILGMIFFRQFIDLPLSAEVISMGIIVSLFAYVMSFIFKMVVGISAFWLVEFSGFSQLVEVIILLFGGYIMPIYLYSGVVRNLAYILPFSYMIYFPVIAFQGKLSVLLFLKVVLVQLIWIILFILIFRYLWKKGVYKFTGVGN